MTASAGAWGMSAVGKEALAWRARQEKEGGGVSGVGWGMGRQQEGGVCQSLSSWPITFAGSFLCDGARSPPGLPLLSLLSCCSPPADIASPHCCYLLLSPPAVVACCFQPALCCQPPSPPFLPPPASPIPVHLMLPLPPLPPPSSPTLCCLLPPSALHQRLYLPLCLSAVKCCLPSDLLFGFNSYSIFFPWRFGKSETVVVG